MMILAREGDNPIANKIEAAIFRKNGIITVK
jgi:hypothetical protein